MKSILFALLILQAAAFAKEEEKKEVSTHITALENEKISENILTSKLYADCKKQVEAQGKIDKDQVRQCIQKAVEAASEDQLEEIGSALEIRAAKFKETQGSKSLKDYLSKRIFDAIHGEGAYENKKIKEMKFVDQGMFLDMYKTQVSKNMILEISQYCLENLGTKNREELFFGFGSKLEDIEANFKKASAGAADDVPYISLSVAKKGTKSNDPWSKLPGATLPDKANRSEAPKAFWDNIIEYKYCPVVKDDDNNSCDESVARNAQQISVLKDQELELAKKNTNILSLKYASCSQVVIKNMCEIYRCNNVYTDTSSSLLYKPDQPGTPNAKPVCKNLYDIDVGSASNSVSLEVSSNEKARGQIACNVLKKVERYKNTFAAIDEMKKKNSEMGKATGLKVGTTFKGEYDRKGMDNLTSISSKELVENVETFKDGEDGAKELEDKCFAGGTLSSDEECQTLVGSVNQADLTKIQLDTEAETQAYLARVKKLKENGKDDEVRQYLIDNGLHEYAEMYGEGLDVDQAIALISDKYQADRKALINNMQKRFENLTQKDDSAQVGNGAPPIDPEAEKKKVAENNLEEMKQHKERLETLFNYSNIVSSYLTVSDGKGNETQNTRARAIETEGLKEYDPENAEAAYGEYFVDGGVDDSKDSISAQGKFIDNILGLGASDE